MADIFNTEDSVFFVGGTGTKAGIANPGGCTKQWWGDLKNPNKNLSDIMGANGAPLIAETACTYTHSLKRIAKSGAFGNAEVGMVAYISGTNITTGRYIITAVDESGNYVECSGIESTGDNTDTLINIGGAFISMRNASDETTASAASPHNVEILTNKSETFTIPLHEIGIDVGGGSGSDNTFKRIVGIDGDGIELADGSYVEFNGNGQSCNIFKIVAVSNIEFRHIYARDSGSSYNGFAFITTAGTSNGCTLSCCKSTGCNHAVYANDYNVSNLQIRGGFYSATNQVFYLYEACYVSLLKVELDSDASEPLIYGNVVGHLIIDGCFLRKTSGLCGNGITMAGIYGNCLLIKNSVIYNINSCITLAQSKADLISYNNIFVLHTASTGKYIFRISGSILYSDYSCGWAIDGAPAASGRWGGTGVPDNAIEEDPELVDADNGDFTPQNNNCIYGGLHDFAGNVTEMGAILKMARPTVGFGVS